MRLPCSPSEAAREVLQSAEGLGRPNPQRPPSLDPSAPPRISDLPDIRDLEEELSEVADTLEMVYDEVEGAGEQRYIGVEEAGDMLGLKGKTVLAHVSSELNNLSHVFLQGEEQRVPRNRTRRLR